MTDDPIVGKPGVSDGPFDGDGRGRRLGQNRGGGEGQGSTQEHERSLHTLECDKARKFSSGLRRYHARRR
jgi:hypothetical protein